MPEFVFHWRGGDQGPHQHAILRRDGAGDYVVWLTLDDFGKGRQIVRDLNYAAVQRAKLARAEKRRKRLRDEAV